MKTILHKIFYTIGGCACGVAVAVLLLVPVELSKSTHDWLNNSSGNVIFTVIFFALVIAGGFIGYRRSLQTIRDGVVPLGKTVLILCLCIASSGVVIWASLWYVAMYSTVCCAVSSFTS